jgi:hypothetical protein
MTDSAAALLAPEAPAPAPVPIHQDPATAWAPPQTVHERADALRSQLIGNPEFRQKALNGDLAARRQLAALDSIKISDPNADPAALQALADQAGLVEFPRPAAAPAISGLSAQAPSASDYRPTYNGSVRSSPNFSDIHAGLTGFAAEMRFNAPLGKAVIERIAEMSPQITFDMSEEQRQVWIMSQDQQGARMAGDWDSWVAMKSEARKAIADLGGKQPWSKLIAESTVMNDAWLVTTLARYYRSRNAAGKG